MRVLVIDDAESIRKTVTVFLNTAGHDVLAVATGKEALGAVEEQHFDVALLDLKLDGESGLDLLPKLLQANPEVSVVVFTAFASIDSAVEAMRRGAADYVPKPFTPEQIRQVFDKITRTRALEQRVADLESRLRTYVPAADLTSEEPAVRRVLDMAFKAADTPASILLLGESGTGKSVLARAIHEHSSLRDKPFVTLDCPSLPRDLLESELFGHAKGAFTGATSETWGKVAAADGGTLFLDEIGDLALATQPKLLRLLNDKEYERIGETKTRRANVRVIAATNRDLEQTVKEGRFREDLFYRLNVITLRMPPLRERRVDLPQFAHNYLRLFARQCGKKIEGYSPAVTETLQRHAWPGNLRELRNAIERAVILAEGPQIELKDLPETLVASPQAPPAVLCAGASVTLEALEEEHIRLVVQHAATLEEAARVLGIDPATLYRRRKKMAAAEPVRVA